MGIFGYSWTHLDMDRSKTKIGEDQCLNLGLDDQSYFRQQRFENESIDCPSIVASRSSSSPRSPCHRQLRGVPTHNNPESISGKFLK